MGALTERWGRVLQECGSGRPALFSPDGRCLWTFGDLEREAEIWAGRVGGFGPGAVVGICAANSVGWLPALLGMARTGVVVLPMGVHLGLEERGRALATAGASAVIEEAEGGGFRLRELDPGERQERRVPIDPRCRLLKMTSGTTSAPRLIQFTEDQLVADCDAVCESMGIGADDLNYGAIPFSHSYGFSNLVTPLLCRGVRLVVSGDCLPRALLEGFAQTGATVFPGTPVLFQSLVGLGDFRVPDPMRLFISAGAPLAPVVATKFAETCGRKIHAFYGSSECGGISFDASDVPVQECGFVGTAMRGVTIARMEGGRIGVSGPAVGLGYFPEPEEETLGGGRFVPGDLVEHSGSGWRIVGRVSEWINVAGRKVNPSAVEEALSSCPGIRQVAVFGVPSAVRNEEIVACVAGEVGPEIVRAHAASRLATWQVPRHVWVVPEIPHNERGKISRRELAAAFRESGGQGA